MISHKKYKELSRGFLSFFSKTFSLHLDCQGFSKDLIQINNNNINKRVILDIEKSHFLIELNYPEEKIKECLKNSNPLEFSVIHSEYLKLFTFLSQIINGTDSLKSGLLNFEGDLNKIAPEILKDILNDWPSRRNYLEISLKTFEFLLLELNKSPLKGQLNLMNEFLSNNFWFSLLIIQDLYKKFLENQQQENNEEIQLKENFLREELPLIITNFCEYFFDLVSFEQYYEIFFKLRYLRKILLILGLFVKNSTENDIFINKKVAVIFNKMIKIKIEKKLFNQAKNVLINLNILLQLLFQKEKDEISSSFFSGCLELNIKGYFYSPKINNFSSDKKTANLLDIFALPIITHGVNFMNCFMKICKITSINKENNSSCCLNISYNNLTFELKEEILKNPTKFFTINGEISMNKTQEKILDFLIENIADNLIANLNGKKHENYDFAFNFDLLLTCLESIMHCFPLTIPYILNKKIEVNKIKEFLFFYKEEEENSYCNNSLKIDFVDFMFEISPFYNKKLKAFFFILTNIPYNFIEFKNDKIFSSAKIWRIFFLEKIITNLEKILKEKKILNELFFKTDADLFRIREYNYLLVILINGTGQKLTRKDEKIFILRILKILFEIFLFCKNYENVFLLNINFFNVLTFFLEKLCEINFHLKTGLQLDSIPQNLSIEFFYNSKILNNFFYKPRKIIEELHQSSKKSFNHQLLSPSENYKTLK